MTEPTKRPWNVLVWDGFHIIGENEEVIDCGYSISESNARHIVKCVNLHEELVEALRLADDLIRNSIGVYGFTLKGGESPDDKTEWAKTWLGEHVPALLAKAKENKA